MKKAASIELGKFIILGIILIGALFIFISLLPSDKSEALIIGNGVSTFDQEKVEQSTVQQINKETSIEEIDYPNIEEETFKSSANSVPVVTGSSSSSGSSKKSSGSSSTSTASGSIIENEFGKIEFSKTFNFDLKDFVTIEQNFIDVDSEAMPQLNIPAVLTLKNVDYDYSPIIIRDGKICYECEVLSYSDNELVFSVPHFSSYSSLECTGLDQDLYLNSGKWTCNLNIGTNNAKIIINSSDVELDCDDSTIDGGNAGTGIFVKEPDELTLWENENNDVDFEKILQNITKFIESITFLDNITIINCNLANFEFGTNISALTNSRIINNSFSNATAFFALKDSIIEGNEFMNSEIGLAVLGLNNSIINNNAHDNKNGIGVGGIGNQIIGNIVSENLESGIAILFSNETEINNNIMINNKIGLSLTESSYNIVKNNLIKENEEGIALGGLFSQGPSKENIIKNNTIIYNKNSGIKVSDGTLINLFKLLTGKKRVSFMVTGNFIVSNKLDNPSKNILVEGDGFVGNDISDNQLLDGISDLSCDNYGTNLRCGVVGEINTNLDDVSVESINGLVEFKQGMKTIASFDFNFTGNVLNLSNIKIEKQNAQATKGYIFVKGIAQADGTTKTLYLDNINTNMNWLCIKDAEITDVSEITPNCNGAYETIVQCNGILNRVGYRCTNTGSQYKIEGLKHSGAIQYEPDFRYFIIGLKGDAADNLDLGNVAYPWDNPTYMGAHSGPGTNCSGAGCWSRYIQTGIINFNLTDTGYNKIGTMQLDGSFFATTAKDQITYTGMSMLWGTANMDLDFNGTIYNGTFKIVSEEWQEWDGVLAMINETGEYINITQFVINMSKALSDHEIVIRKNPQVTIHNLTDNVRYSVNVNELGTIEYMGDYETMKYNMTGNLSNIKNRTTFIGKINVTTSPNNFTIIDGWGKAWYDTNDSKYHSVFYGSPFEGYIPAPAECFIDEDCNDSNIATLDRCIDKYETKVCSNQIPNIYGTVVDALSGAPLEGKKISIYSAQDRNLSFEKCLNYDENGNEIGDCELQPKANPDAITDSNGQYYIVAPPGKYHIVVSGSREDTLNRYVGNEVDHIYLPENGTIKVVVEPERIEAGFHSSAYVNNNGKVTKVFQDSHVTQTPVRVNVSKTNNLEFFINVNAYDPYTFKYNLSTIDDNNHVTCYDRKYNLTGTDSSNQVIIDQLDGDTWRLWFEDLPPGHHWIVDNMPKEPDYDDVVFLLDYTPIASNITNETENNTYDCDDDGIPNYLDNDDEECDYGDIHTEIVNETSGELYSAGQIFALGRYRNKNSYLPNETVKFMIFGTNNMSTDETVTYTIEEHTHNPYKGVAGNVVYQGEISLDEESLLIENDGEVWKKNFSFNIPANASSKIDFNKDGDYDDIYDLDSAGPYSEAELDYDLNHDGDMEDNYSVGTEFFESDGRYDIHIWYNGSKWHKIGDFYVIPDIPPVLVVQGQDIYTNETAQIRYSAYDPVALIGVFYTGTPPDTNVTVDLQLNETNGIETYNSDDEYYYINFTESGHYNVTFTATNSRGKSVTEKVPVNVWITEDEADMIGMPIYFQYDDMNEIMGYDFYYFVTSTNPFTDAEFDRFDIEGYYNIGDEYITKWDLNNGPNYLNQSEINALNYEIENFCPGNAEYVKPILPSTAEEYTETLSTFLMRLKCDCSHITGGPACT